MMINERHWHDVQGNLVMKFQTYEGHSKNGLERSVCFQNKEESRYWILLFQRNTQENNIITNDKCVKSKR